MATEAMSAICAHCGLPLANLKLGSSDTKAYCCYACRMVAAIVGRRDHGVRSWHLMRLGFGVLLSMNVMTISILLYGSAIETELIPVFRTLLLCFSSGAMAILLPPFLTGGWRELRNGRPSLDVLIASGALSAYAVSIVHTVAQQGEVYFDTATMLPVLVTFGRLIESTARSRAGDLLNGLERLLPQKAVLVTGAGHHEVNLDQIHPGDLIRVRPGERLPVDGTILEGCTSIEEAAFTGEFVPRNCSPGSHVIAGTINGHGPILVQADKTGSDLMLHGIMALVRDAWQHPSRAELLAGRLARVFLPVVLVCAAAALVAWTIAGDQARGWLSALSVLVVACPCTIGIATPLATSLAIGRAAKAGILVRGGAAMEKLSAVDLLFFDKTGTLTAGRPVLERIETTDPQVEVDELLGRLAALESCSNHVLAAVIVAEAKRRGLPISTAEQVEFTPGGGISGTVAWQGHSSRVTAGSAAFVAAPGRWAEPSGTVVDVVWDGRHRGRMLFRDALRDDAGDTVKRLHERGISCAVLSGDNHAAVQEAAMQAGIAQVCSACPPAGKLAAVKTAAATGRVVAMVGDGINDAPALAAADVGIAFGTGPDLARHAGEVVILGEALGRLDWLIALSGKTRKIVRCNLAWSFGYNAIALAAAMAGMLHPLLAALAMAGSSLSVLASSMRITAFPGPDRHD